ncbi:NrdH [Serratia phage 4S]|nr:NrdH [Serratia phage 4S]
MIEIYYIPEEIRKCYSCVRAKELAQETTHEIKMYPIMKISDNDLGFEYNLDVIDELKERVGSSRRAFIYPQIFIDGIHIGSLSALQQHVEEVWGFF